MLVEGGGQGQLANQKPVLFPSFVPLDSAADAVGSGSPLCLE